MNDDDDVVMRGFFHMKSLLMEAEERFGHQGIHVLALAGVMRTQAREKGETVTVEECYRFLVELADAIPDAMQATMERFINHG